jgi:hypothetical protein
MSFDAGSIVASLQVNRTDFATALEWARGEADKGVQVQLKFSPDARSLAGALSSAQAAATAAGITAPLGLSVSKAAVAGAVTSAQAMLRAAPVTVPVSYSVNQASLLSSANAARTSFGGESSALGNLASSASFAAVQTASLAAATGVADAAAGAAKETYTGFGVVAKLLTTQVSLFGGALGKIPLLGEVAGWHILLDSIIEVSAILVPVSIALGAFAVAGVSTAMAIYTQFMNMNTVMKATGGVVPQLTRGFGSLASAVQPSIYQMLGDAFVIMNNNGGTFGKTLQGIGSVLDQLATRITLAVTSGNGMGTFLTGATADLSKFGNAWGDLFGIIGNVLKVMPGYAEILLDVGTDLLGVAEAASRVLEPVLGFALALHGAILWGGLAVTIVVGLGRAFISLGASVLEGVQAVQAWAAAGAQAVAVNAAVADAATAATIATGRQAEAMASVAVAAEGSAAGQISFAVASDGTAVAVDAETASIWGLDAAMAALDAVNPLVWVGIAVAAIGGLTYAILHSKDATQQWAASLQQTVQAASVAGGLTAIGQAQEQVLTRLTAAEVKLNDTTEYGTTVNLHTGTTSRGVTEAYELQEKQVNELTGALVQLNTEAALQSQRIGDLAKTYGGTATATGLLVTAGITEKQMLDSSASAWAQIQEQVEATQLGYRAMGIAGGTLGNDMQIVTDQSSDQYTAMGKLNTSLKTFVTNMTAGQTAFDTWAQGLATMGTDAKAAGTSIDGLDKNSLTLNAAFETQVNNANTLAASFRTAGLASNLQAQGIKDIIAPLTQYAKGSQEATAQLVGLAQEAGYNGPVSLTLLTKWLGNTHDATRNLQDITHQATIQESLLTTSMRDQGAYIANTLIGDINSAILKYDGVQKAATAWGNAIAQDGRQSDAAQAARTRLINDLVASGKAAGDSTTQIAALITKVTGIPKSEAIKITEQAEGKYYVSQGVLPTPTGKPVSPDFFNAASGMLVTRGRPGVDDQLIMAQKGETVVPAHLTPAVAPLMKAHGVPGFASGGVVGTDASGLAALGSMAVTSHQVLAATAANALLSGLNAAEQAAIAAAWAGGSGSASFSQIEDWWTQAGGPGGGTAQVAAAITGAESGFNPRAVQQGQPYATTGWGLWQITPGDSEPQFGINQALLNGPANARAAVAKYRGAGGFSPWTTFEDGAYLRFLSGGTPAGGLGVHAAYATGTPGAARGWAKVGENGPEMVWMHGGETVIPSPGTSGGRGYAAGTGGNPLIGGDVNMTLPEGTTVAQALQEMTFRLRVAQMQGN